MSVYRILEHASPALINAAPTDGSPPIFLAIIGQHWQDISSMPSFAQLDLTSPQGPCENDA
jgi:hypothetical protein